jgi:hypothetical protein
MYKTNRHLQTRSLDCTSAQKLDPQSSMATHAPRSPTSRLRAIVTAIAWMSEIRTMPFGGLELAARRDERPNQDY